MKINLRKPEFIEAESEKNKLLETLYIKERNQISEYRKPLLDELKEGFKL